MAMQFETILYEREDAVAWITLNRPNQLNSFSGNMREELLHAILDAQESPQVHAIVITGSGKAFCTGGDLKHMAKLKSKSAGFEELRPLLDQGRHVVTVIHECPKPIIAMVNGVAAGAGCNLALACDLRIAGEYAVFTQSFIKVGLHPDWGGTYFLPRLIGQGRALEMMLTGKRVEAEEALEIGLVHQVVPSSHLRENTKRMAARLAAAPATAARLIKMAVYGSLDNDLAGMLEFECEAQRQCWNSPESAEGITAFSQKRRPAFERNFGNG